MKKKSKAKKVILVIVIALVAIFAVAAIANYICYRMNISRANEYQAVENPDAVIPVQNEKGEYVFKTDRELKVIQLTDIHIGSGWMSFKKDRMAINAVAAMITAEKPDLVVMTGDIAYPVPFQAGTLNNKYPAKIIMTLMERLGVNYTVVFGNHDTEMYSYFSRESIGSLYESEEYPHCLFTKGPEAVDGVGNQIIRVENTQGKLTQALFLFDSHSYTDHDYFGIFWKYDNIHENQVEWYKQNILEMQKENPDVKSMMFFHIPLVEFREAVYEYQDNGNQSTADVKYISGDICEKDPHVFCGIYEDNLFETVQELGSTQAIFCGHDHINNMVLNYKGVDFIYGNSIDYLAYAGIYKKGDHRGCTVINISPDGSYTQSHENYYQDKYQPLYPKEEVSFGSYAKAE